MKVLVFSDCHGNTRYLEDAISSHPEINDIIFLGDGISDVDDVACFYPTKSFYCVTGNCDRSDMRPSSSVISIGSVKMYLSHGHYMHSLEDLVKTVKENGAEVVLFGHTHFAKLDYTDGVHIMNPGSISIPRDEPRPSYGILELTEKGILKTIIRI